LSFELAGVKSAHFKDKNYYYFDHKGRAYDTFEGNKLEKRLRSKFLKSKETVLDLGAFVGGWSIPAALIKCNVIAVEPNPDHVALLLANLNLNKLTAQVKPHAVWEKDGEIIYDGYVTQKGTAKVPCKAINEMNLPHIDFIKMDVEGAELQVIAGAFEIIERDKPRMLIECHSNFAMDYLEWALQGLRIPAPVDYGGYIYVSKESYKNMQSQDSYNDMTMQVA
jgi:FkbM family methyltransferase